MAYIICLMAGSGRYSIPTTCSSIISEKEMQDNDWKSPESSLSKFFVLQIPENNISIFTYPDDFQIESIKNLMNRLPILVSELQETVQSVSVKDECSIQNKNIIILDTGRSMLIRKRTVDVSKVS